MRRVIPVSSRADVADFIAAARPIYGSDSPWIPPLDKVIRDYLDPKENPFFSDGSAQAWIVRDERGSVCGRVLAHIWRRHARLHGEAVAYFGFFESIDDQDVANLLLGAAVQFARANGCDRLRGPINMTMAQEMGALTEGFEHAPAIDMVYTPKYYPRLFSGCGFGAVLSASTWKNADISTAGAADAPSSTTRYGPMIAFRSLRRWSRDRDMEQVRQVVNAAFLGNPGFVPITRDEWVFQIGPLLPLMDPSLVQLAEAHDTMVGVSLVVPDFNLVLSKTNGRLWHPALARLLSPRVLPAATVILFAVRKQFQGLGISHALNQRLIATLKRRGYRELSITWIADENTASIAQAAALGMARLHRVALFEKAIT